MTLSDQEKVAHYIEVWKQTITVQQHFNDIEWRIRGLALTAATFAIGAAAVAANDGQSGVSVIILIIGVVLWYAFYFVDRFWYHPLLIGSVKHGEKVEQALSQVLPAASLTRSISDASPVNRPLPIKLLSLGKVQQPDGSGGTESVSRRSTKLHSSAKLGWFYTIGGVALLGSAVGLGIYSVSVEPSKPNPVIVKFDPTTVPTPFADPSSPPTSQPSPTKGSRPANEPSPTASP